MNQSHLARACASVGIDCEHAEPIRVGENAIYRLSHGIIVRISRRGQAAAATNEVQVARWLQANDVPAVRALAVDQPIVLDGCAATFWHELPAHRPGTPREVGATIRRLHNLPVPTEVELPPLAPFVRLQERIDAATTLSDNDRGWLRVQLHRLRTAYANLPMGLPHGVIHGDAWAGNVVTTESGQSVLLDLERCSIGPPEWDLVSTAVKFASYGHIDADEYAEFTDSYGHDVIAWEGFEILRDIRELRVTCYAAQRATEDRNAEPEAAKRIASIRGQRGPRPWTDWRPFA